MKTMRAIVIKGKSYIPVNERIKEFREQYPNLRVLTEIVNLTEDSVVMKATVVDMEGHALANGYAQEDRGSSNINKTSYVENCETSAVGRALGMFGIGIDASVASADEVANAIERQEALKEKVNKNAISSLKMLAAQKGSDLEMILSYYDVQKIEDMTMEQWQNAMNLLNKKK